MGLPGDAPKGHGPRLRCHRSGRLALPLLAATILLATFHRGFYSGDRPSFSMHLPFSSSKASGPESSPFGKFPQPDDPFHFLPCTNRTIPPPLDDADPDTTWQALFDPDPANWSWGHLSTSSPADLAHQDGPYSGRGIYLCGYLDVPLNYLDNQDDRIVRLSVTKFQVSGLAPLRHCSSTTAFSASQQAGRKSERTLIVEPGGPGGSGSTKVWSAAEELTMRFSDGQYDVFGWDPRGVNNSLPSAACFPHDAFRDRWSPLRLRYREVSPSPRAQLEYADAMNDAVFAGCRERLGDFGRFIGTGDVARDLEELRKALDEPEVTGYFVSYGTGIGQTYANMYPDRVGRLIMDGTEFVLDHRKLGGFGWTALDNTTDAWRDGFLGECLQAGPENCALAKQLLGGHSSDPVTLSQLEGRMDSLLKSIIERPVPAYLPNKGPYLIEYTQLVEALYSVMYNPLQWQSTAQALAELEMGNTTLAAQLLNKYWSGMEFDPTASSTLSPKPKTIELTNLVVCADSFDAPQPEDGLVWWDDLWRNMTSQSWIAGNSRFYDVFPCRHYTKYWSDPPVYRGHLSHTLKSPALLIAETYDPATPLRNGRRLLEAMGDDNARLIVHHGYGHSSSRDLSRCTNSLARDYILHGKLPEERETDCYPDEKPYRYAASQLEEGILDDTWVVV